MNEWTLHRSNIVVTVEDAMIHRLEWMLFDLGVIKVIEDRRPAGLGWGMINEEIDRVLSRE